MLNCFGQSYLPQAATQSRMTYFARSDCSTADAQLLQQFALVVSRRANVSKMSHVTFTQYNTNTISKKSVVPRILSLPIASSLTMKQRSVKRGIVSLQTRITRTDQPPAAQPLS